MAAHSLVVHHGLLVLHLMILFWMLDLSIWSTAAQQGSEEIHMGMIRDNETTQSESESIQEKRDCANKNVMGFYPVPLTKYLPWPLSTDDNSRRKLAPFQLCSGCTCCASENNKNVCTTSACCYSITCGLPDKPYGVCAFTPKACNCTNCGV